MPFAVHNYLNSGEKMCLPGHQEVINLLKVERATKESLENIDKALLHSHRGCGRDFLGGDTLPAGQ